MLTYYEHLRNLADKRGIELKDAFLAAGVPDSTYYRAKHGMDLRWTTAKKVEDAIHGWDET